MIFAAAAMLPAIVLAQTNTRGFEVGGQIATTTLREFNGRDTGFGARVGWRPGGMLRAEAVFNIYPSEFPDRFPFSRGRTEGLFGVTFGPRIGRVEAFGRFRPGFVTFGEAPEPIACIAIFPPPLSCRLAGGDTMLALDVGGGIAVTTSANTFLRVDVGDRAIRYPGPTFDSNRQVRSEPFFRHDFRFAAGAGLRF
jgi:hypothetical protein